jgi:transposase InsO family protein
MNVSQSSYYLWLSGKTSKRRRSDEELLKEIQTIYDKSRCTYGSPRIHSKLEAKGIKTSKKRVARLMKESKLVSKVKRKFKATTNSNHNLEVKANILKQNFQAFAPNMKWTSDITYIWTQEGWLYLAVILDLFNRQVISWQVSKSLSKEFVYTSIEKAVKRRKPAKGNLIFHSDRGVQYASNEVKALLERNKIQQSMSRKGNCYDNAVTETFFKTLKTELIYQNHYRTREEAKLSIFEYIEIFYNRQRVHSSLNYMTPIEFENKFVNSN